MINLTPHAITIRRPDGTDAILPPSGVVARVSTEERVVADLDGVPVVERVLGAVTGLCEEPCIVSAMVLAAVPGRPNTYAPDSGATAIRDERGQIIAVTRLVKA